MSRGFLQGLELGIVEAATRGLNRTPVPTQDPPLHEAKAQGWSPAHPRGDAEAHAPLAVLKKRCAAPTALGIRSCFLTQGLHAGLACYARTALGNGVWGARFRVGELGVGGLVADFGGQGCYLLARVFQ